MSEKNRLNGWKAIGAHFNRDRTTVMRWARERGLPVRRLPGGKTATVYALIDDLNQWAENQTDLNDDVEGDVTDTIVSETTAQPAGLNKKYLILALSLGLIAMTGIGLNLWGRNHAPLEAQRTLPSDPALAKIYLTARDEWAQRRPENINHAITLLTTLVEKDPKFARGWSGLADAYLLAREFDAMPDAQAFEKAKWAAEKAVALDPNLADAHRALGFVEYWWENNPIKAGKAFTKAVDLSPSSAQTHFWYGNILIDNGQMVSGLKELSLARQIEPGSVAIQTDLAWAQWSAGDTSTALMALNQLSQTAPDFPVIYDCLSMIKLTDGDYVGYVQALTDYARLKRDESLYQLALALKEDIKIGADAVQKRLMDQAAKDIASGSEKTHLFAVLYASVAQDRQLVVTLLNQAEQRHETWSNAGIIWHIQRLWFNDPEINGLIDRRKAPPVPYHQNPNANLL